MLCVAAGITPPATWAATYDVWTCADGSGRPLGVGSWAPFATHTSQQAAPSCGNQGGSIGALSAAAYAGQDVGGLSQTGAGWKVAAAPGTEISALDLWWAWSIDTSGAHKAIHVTANGNTWKGDGTLNPLYAGCGYSRAGCPNTLFLANRGAFGSTSATDPAVTFGSGNHQTFATLTPGTTSAGVEALCIGMCATGTNHQVAGLVAYRVKTTVVDSTPPAGTSSGLANGQRVGPGTPVRVAATDVGGGVRELMLRVDDRVVQRAGASGACADIDPSNASPLEYALMKPCPTELSATLALSADQLPDSAVHTVSAVAVDAAGQETTLGSARASLAAPSSLFDAHNGFYNPDLDINGGHRPNGASADASARLSLGFVNGHRLRTRQIVGYATHARVRGRVRTAAGAPIAGARVWRAVRVRSREWRISGKPLVSSRTGRVSARLPAHTPSRDVRLVYFPFADSNQNAGSPVRPLKVRATSTLHTDQGGYRNYDRAVFSGRLYGRASVANRFVLLQSQLEGGGWQTFKTSRTDSKGRWRMKRRFRFARRATIYRLRIKIPRQSHWPYADGYSRTLRVIVTP
jgi:hypothetical protein